MARLTRRSAIRLFSTASATLTLGDVSVLAQAPTEVRVGASVDSGLLPLLYAQSGLFSKSGLDVRLIGGQNGAAVAAAVVAGDLQFGKSALLALIAARARGLSFKIVAGAAEGAPGRPTNLLCALKGGSVRSLADVTGKTVVVNTLRGLDMLGTQVLINASGGDASRVNFVELPNSAMMAALEQGRVDVASIGYPHLPGALASGQILTLGDPYRGISKHSILIAGWFTTRDYIERNRSVVDRFAGAMRDANAYCNTHRSQTAALLADYAKIDLALVMAMSQVLNATKLDPQDIQPAIDAAAKYKYIPEAFSAKDLML